MGSSSMKLLSDNGGVLLGEGADGRCGKLSRDRGGNCFEIILWLPALPFLWYFPCLMKLFCRGTFKLLLYISDGPWGNDLDKIWWSFEFFVTPRGHVRMSSNTGSIFGPDFFWTEYRISLSKKSSSLSAESVARSRNPESHVLLFVQLLPIPGRGAFFCKRIEVGRRSNWTSRTKRIISSVFLSLQRWRKDSERVVCRFRFGESARGGLIAVFSRVSFDGLTLETSVRSIREFLFRSLTFATFDNLLYLLSFVQCAL